MDQSYETEQFEIDSIGRKGGPDGHYYAIVKDKSTGKTYKVKITEKQYFRINADLDVDVNEVASGEVVS